MKVFSNADFNNDKVKFLQFDNDFEFDDSNKIIFGFNGIGKSTIYNYLKDTQESNYKFLDYEHKPKFTGAGKAFVISLDITNLNALLEEKPTLEQRLSLSNYFKTINIKKANLSNYPEGINVLFSSKETFKIPEIKKELFEKVVKCINDNEIPTLLKKLPSIKAIYDIQSEIKDYSEQYLLEIYDILDKHYDHESKVCPICGTKNVNIFEHIEKKKKELETLASAIFGNLHYVASKPENQQSEAIRKMVSLANELTFEYLITINMSGSNYEKYTALVKDYKRLEQIKTEIENIKDEKNKFYTNMSENKDYVKVEFERLYTGSEITFDDKEQQIKIKLPRSYETYSTGELNELCLVINLLSFKGSNKKLLIIDDPLSSYDFTNQYRTMFRIIRTVKSKDKAIIIFTHNIDTLNITNTQYYGIFKYYYIEKYNSTLYLQKINLTNNNSIMSLESLTSSNKYIGLLVYRENSNIRKDFDGDKVFHYDDANPFIFHCKNPCEKDFEGLGNKYFIDLIDNFNIKNNSSFIDNTITKILHLCGIRVWIEKRIYDFIESLPDTDKQNYLEKYKKENLAFKRCKLVWDLNEFKMFYQNFNKESLMIKKVMINQDLHYKSQITPFNYAINISLDNLKQEINDIKNLFIRS